MKTVLYQSSPYSRIMSDTLVMSTVIHYDVYSCLRQVFTYTTGVADQKKKSLLSGKNQTRRNFLKNVSSYFTVAAVPPLCVLTARDAPALIYHRNTYKVVACFHIIAYKNSGVHVYSFCLTRMTSKCTVSQQSLVAQPTVSKNNSEHQPSGVWIIKHFQCFSCHRVGVSLTLTYTMWFLCWGTIDQIAPPLALMLS